MAVVIPLNNFPGPADDTVTAQTYYRIQATPPHRDHLSTDFEQTLRQHDAGRAADLMVPVGEGGGMPLSLPPTRIHPC